jgi:hypothetical protein
MGAADVPPKKPALTHERMNVVMPKPAIPTGTGSTIESALTEGCAARASVLGFSEITCIHWSCSLLRAGTFISYNDINVSGTSTPS